MSADLDDRVWCHLCGHPLDRGVCLRCDRPGRRWWDRRRHTGRRGRWWGALAAVLLAFAIAAAGFGWFGGRSTVHPSAEPNATTPAAPTSKTRFPLSTSSAPSTFEVLGGEIDVFGNRSPRGLAFVIRTGPQSSDLLTDYHLVVESYTQGNDTVDLQQGDETFTARIVTVSSDPHVALLRVNGVYPSLVISATAPKVGDRVTVGELTWQSARNAAVVAYSGPGGAVHLAFSVAIPNVDDGAPVVNGAGRVVGIAEPTPPYSVDGVGLAIPILSACLAVNAC